MDYTRNTMRAAIKSLEAVIAPTVEATGQAQAIQQLHLVVDFLKFAEQRIHLIADRERQQLLGAIALADTLSSLFDGAEEQDGLLREKAAAEKVAADPMREGESVRLRTAGLEASIRRCIVAADAMSDERRRAVEEAALEASQAQAATDRVWLLPFGFDPEPDSLLDIHEALAAAVARP
ncbi:hypothetical protein ACW14X_28620 [Nocardioides sp. YJ-D4]